VAGRTNARMKLLYVVKRFPKVSETFILQEIQELGRQGESVSVCSLRVPFDNQPRQPGADELARRTLYIPEDRWRSLRLVGSAILTLVRLPRRAWPALGWAIKWAVRERHIRHLKRFGEACYIRTRIPGDVEHIHAHFGHAPATVALLLSRFSCRPFSFTGHANDIFFKPSPALLRAKIAEARLVVTVAEHGRRYLAELADPGDREKIVVVRNGVDRGRFAPRAGEPAGDVPIVLCVSRLVEIKGLDTLVDACGLLAARGVGFRCEVIGGGHLRHALEERARSNGLSGHLKLAGALDHHAVRAAHDRACVFALPSNVTESGRRDELPCAIVEAQSVGLPVVTTPVSAIPEAVEHEESGLLIPPRDADALAQAIERLLSDHELRARLARGGQATAERFDLASVVGRLRDLFHNGCGAA
jgi:glycosyltransferase involved in cell wall biosynthesis